MKRTIDNLPVYNIIPLDNDDFEIALVENPAIGEDFLKFADEKVKYEFSKDKQNIKGPVLIPNLPIYRRNPERYVIFTEEAIKKSQELFMKNGSKFNINHSDKEVELEIVDNYIVKEDSGQYKKGTWVLEAHIADLQLWEEIKNDTFNGFSVESMFIHLSKENSQMDVLKQIKTLLDTVLLEEEVKPAEEAPKVEDAEASKIVAKIDELIADYNAFKESINERISNLENGSNTVKEEMSKIKEDVEKFGAQPIESVIVTEKIDAPSKENKFKEYFE